MKIAIDCRYLGMSGIGRVLEGILDNLDFKANDYYLVGNRAKLAAYPATKIIDDDTSPFSKSGLLKFNKKEINKVCDCIIIPNFIIPLGIKIKVHTIMHDLIFLDMKELTTNGFVDYQIKKYLLSRCMKKSASISCVSKFTLSRCEHYFGKYAKKCYLNYVGLSRQILEYAKKHNEEVEKSNTIVYVGNVKPHKGLSTLLEAFAGVEGYKLKIIGERDNFITGLKLDESAYKNVEFTGKISDDELFDEIKHARYLVQPSQYEGFGAPPLEALYLGTQPIISNIEVFNEIYSSFPVIFFTTPQDLRAKIIAPPAKITCQTQILQTYSYQTLTSTILKHIV